MTENMSEWNRNLALETIQLLEASSNSTADAIERLRGFLAVNPGGPVVLSQDHEIAVAELAK